MGGFVVGGKYENSTVTTHGINNKIVGRKEGKNRISSTNTLTGSAGGGGSD